MAAKLFYLPFPTAFTSNGLAEPGAKLYFYLSGTSTPTPSYTTSALTTQHASPVVANGAGRFPSVYLNDAIEYRLVIKDSDGNTLDDIDPFVPGTLYGAMGPTGSIEVSGLVFFTLEQFDPLAGSASSYDCYPAWVAMMTYLRALTAAEGPLSAYRRTPAMISLGGKTYYFSDTPDVDGVTIHLKGAHGGGNQNGGLPTTILVAPGKAGIRIQNWDTTGSTGTRSTTVGASGSVIEDIQFATTGAGGSTTADGIEVRTFAKILNCSAYNFVRHGLHIHATIGGDQGNANRFHVEGGNYHHNGKCGVFIDGADANAGLIRGVNVTENGTWGIWDSSFLGNLIEGCHTDQNGVATAGPTYAPQTVSSVCSYSGNRYSVVPGQEVWCSTNAPTGTTASNQGWTYKEAGGAISLYPAWTSGLTWVAGGPFYVNELTAETTLLNCYSENSQAPSRLGQAALAVGGSHVAGLLGARIYAQNSRISAPAFNARNQVSDNTYVNIIIGGDPNNDGQFFALGRSLTEATDITGHIAADLSGKVRYANNDSFQFFGWNSPTDATEPCMFLAPNGARIGNSKQTSGTAAPTTGTHGRGKIVWNTEPSAGGFVGWICTTAGTPGTWKTFGAISA